MNTRITISALTCLVFLVLPWQATAQNFYKKNGGIYDSWQICRTRPDGVDGYFQITEKGFRPIIMFESSASNSSSAYRLGKEFQTRYSDFYQRAEQIFFFARNQITFTQDLEQFGYREFAQNADEMAKEIEKGRARGDCEDYVILLATLYKAAGYRTAIILIPGHTAVLVYLPGYKKANVSLKFKGKSGWVWVEATGRNNPLGWYPETAMQEEALAYEIERIEDLSPQAEPTGEIAQVKVKKKSLTILPFLSVIPIMWIIPMISRIFVIRLIRRGR